jgi:hypothetical protein
MTADDLDLGSEAFDAHAATPSQPDVGATFADLEIDADHVQMNDSQPNASASAR